MQGRRQDGQDHHLHGVGDVGESDHAGQKQLELAESEGVDGLAHSVGTRRRGSHFIYFKSRPC